MLTQLTNIRERLRRGRQRLRDDEQEDGQREEHGDLQRDLLSGIRRQQKAQQRHGGDEDAGEEEVEHVEHGLPLQVDVKRHIRVGLGAAVVDHDVPLEGHARDFELAVGDEAGDVAGGRAVGDVQFQAVVGPGSELR